MWKKEDAMLDAPQEREFAPRHQESPKPVDAPTRGGAIIGPSITIRGEVSGDEDLLIQGKVDGSVNLELHAVTVGGEGRVKADIAGRVVTVEGEVEGDLKARDQVILRSAARVKGDITAPRVVLEDGANFRGLVDMGEGDVERSSSASRRTSQSAASKSTSAGSATASTPSASSTKEANGNAGSGPGSSGSSGGSSPAGKAGKDKDAGASATQDQPAS